METSTTDTQTGKAAYHIKIQEPAEWVERLSIFAKKPLELTRENRDDDALREKAFIQHALPSVREGIRRLTDLGIPCHRPSDFYAEMLKSDNHMAKVRQMIEQKSTEIRDRAKRRNATMQRKYKKELRLQADKQSSKRKREFHDTVRTGKRESARWKSDGKHSEDFDYTDYVTESTGFNQKQTRKAKQPSRSRRKYKKRK
mmetsp:Transcript_11148/g.16842  ORF Transcript_11148/g.16842 Transcript_11148/m.16842 type:complete len:200 (-) Transcript_11148:33-632(-)